MNLRSILLDFSERHIGFPVCYGSFPCTVGTPVIITLLAGVQIVAWRIFPRFYLILLRNQPYLHFVTVWTSETSTGCVLCWRKCSRAIVETRFRFRCGLCRRRGRIQYFVRVTSFTSRRTKNGGEKLAKRTKVSRTKQLACFLHFCILSSCFYSFFSSIFISFVFISFVFIPFVFISFYLHFPRFFAGFLSYFPQKRQGRPSRTISGSKSVMLSSAEASAPESTCSLPSQPV